MLTPVDLRKLLRMLLTVPHLDILAGSTLLWPHSPPLTPHICLLAGKTKLQGFFVGAVMKESKGRANPAELNRILMEQLNASPPA